MDNDFTPAPEQQSLGVQPIQPEPQLAQPIAQPAAQPAMPTIQPEPQPVAQPIVSSSQPEPQPVAQPIVSTESQVQTPTPMQSESQPKPKSKHIGRLVAIIASVIVLLAGAGFAIYYFLILPKDPNYVASRMMNQLGTNLSSGATFSASGSVKISQSSDLGGMPSNSIELGLDSIVTADRHIYIKPSGLTSIISLILSNFNTGAVETGGLAELMEAIAEIDGHWINLNLDEINQQFGSVVDFDCLNGLSVTANKQFSDLYRKYSFITLAPGEDSFYQLSLKQDLLANFLVEYINAASKQDIGQCLASGDFEPFDGFEEITVDDINLDGLESLPALYIALDNNYNLTELKFSLDENGTNAAINFTFAYGAEADKLIPTDAYTFEDLWSVLITDLQSSQRDIQRRNDVARVQTQIVNYQTNNRGLLPDNWDVFRNNYLTVLGDTFTDPDGTDYMLSASNVPVVVPEVLNHTVYITTGAACGGDGEAVAGQPDAYAVQYRLESGALYCVSNL